jgi:hypothetical protein
MLKNERCLAMVFSFFCLICLLNFFLCFFLHFYGFFCYNCLFGIIILSKYYLSFI